MEVVTKAFVVQERWVDAAGKEKFKQHGRRYHARGAAEQLAAMLSKSGSHEFPGSKFAVHDIQGVDGI